MSLDWLDALAPWLIIAAGVFSVMSAAFATIQARRRAAKQAAAVAVTDVEHWV